MRSSSRFLVLFFVCAFFRSFAQEVQPAADSITPPSAMPLHSSPADHTGSLTIEKIVLKPACGEPTDGQMAKFGDTIEFTISNVERLRDKRTLANPIILYANRLPLEGIVGHFRISDMQKLEFILVQSAIDHSDWNEILRTGFNKKTLFVNVGLKDGSLMSETSVPLTFHLRSMLEFIPFLMLVFFLVVLTIYLVWKKGLLRVNTGGDNSYSLSTLHLFFWTSIILISYFVIWYTCNDINGIEPSCLILIGISAGTASAGTIINNSLKKSQSPDPADVNKTQGFFNDIFSENKAISIHRYQIVVFNLVVGVFFLYNVFSELKMPVLNETILTLLGISSATYASLKAIQVKSANDKEEARENVGNVNVNPPVDNTSVN
ncbi:MAG: hypothetical protein JWO09_2642 [Bacteroidetes bacterium]|nr:hypothetical protein [Bacteroidota bacterium]